MGTAITGTSTRRSAAAIVAFVLLAATFIVATDAKGGGTVHFTVTSTNDGVDANPGDGNCATQNNARPGRSGGGQSFCTLRAAIMEANALQTNDPLHDPIEIDLDDQTYNLTIKGANEDGDATGDLDITHDLTITGQGKELTFIDGQGLAGCKSSSDRVFHNIAPSNELVSFGGITVENGNATGPDFEGCGNKRTAPRATGSLGNQLIGGGILNEGLMQLNEMAVNFNEAGVSGGGIYNVGTLTGGNIEVRNNVVGACNAFGRAAARASGNANTNTGGGISNEGVLSVLDESLVAENSVIGRFGGAQPRPSGDPAIAAFGGGIFTSGNGTVDASDVSSNEAFLGNCNNVRVAPRAQGQASDLARGGGIYNDQHVTVSGGSAVGEPEEGNFSGNSAGRGGGIYNTGGQLTGGPVNGLFLISSTVVGNTADFSGGGVHNVGHMEAEDSLIGGNTTFGQQPAKAPARANGFPPNGVGGGLYNSSVAILTDGTLIGDDTPFDPPFTSNSAVLGGGVYNDFNGDLTVNNSRVNGNEVSSQGGGIWNSGSTSVFNDSTVNDNSTTFLNAPVKGQKAKYARASGAPPFPGGGIFNQGFNKSSARSTGLDPDLSVEESTIANNYAMTGAGVWNDGFADINKSTLSNNFADTITKGVARGGGLWNSGNASATNTTFSDNQAENNGGGIWTNFPGDTELLHVTMAFNLAGTGEENPQRPNGQNQGGAIADFSSDTTHYEASLFALNEPQNCAGFPADLDSVGDNVADDSSCNLDETNDLVVGSAVIDDLADNGGPTLTHALLNGSPAIDHVPAAECELNEDQRSAPRPQGTGCDAGAYETGERGGGGGEPSPGPSPSGSPLPSPSPTVTPEPEECPGYEGDPRNDVIGTPEVDVLDGTPEDDIICAFEGNDILRGFDGDDLLLAGPDNDRSYAGPGDDRLRSSTGDDKSYGNDGDDEVRGGRGDDLVEGNDGDDLVRGYENDDIVKGGAGDDRTLGMIGDDDVDGESGNDFVKGGADDDDLNGGPNNDDCNGGKGQDTILNCESGSPRPAARRVADRRSGV